MDVQLSVSQWNISGFTGWPSELKLPGGENLNIFKQLEMKASKFLLQMLRFFYLIGILPHDFNKLLQIDPAVIVDVRLVEESLHLEVSNSATYTCGNVEM